MHKLHPVSAQFHPYMYILSVTRMATKLSTLMALFEDRLGMRVTCPYCG